MTYWREGEDAEVENHVKIHGEGDWKRVAVLLKGRSANSCYLRWFNHLKPGLEHKDITHEEFITIIRLHKQYGSNRWSKIAKKLSEGRPDNLKRTANKIKNFWNGTVKKRASELNLEVDSDLFLVTMTTTPADFGYTNPSTFDGQMWDPRDGQGFDYTLDDVPPFKLKVIDEALDYLYQ